MNMAVVLRVRTNGSELCIAVLADLKDGLRVPESVVEESGES